MSEHDPLVSDLNQIRRVLHWAPLTPEEADAELADISPASLDEKVIDALLQASKPVDVQATTQESTDPWAAKDEIADLDRHTLLLSRGPDLDGEGQTDESERPSDETESEVNEDESPETYPGEPK